MMIIGVPKEIKDHEYRIALTPGGAAALVRAGHQVLVEALYPRQAETFKAMKGTMP